MQRTILSLIPLQVNLRHGHGLRISQIMQGTIIKMIGKSAVSNALKYSVVCEFLTILISIIKQSKERNTLALSPTVLTV